MTESRIKEYKNSEPEQLFKQVEKTLKKDNPLKEAKGDKLNEKVDPSNARALLDDMIEAFGSDLILREISKSMGNIELADNLSYVAENLGYKHHLIWGDWDEDEEEVLDESEKSNKPRLREAASGLKITDYQIDERWIYDTFKDAIIINAKINGKDAKFIFRANRGNDIFFTGISCDYARVPRETGDWSSWATKEIRIANSIEGAGFWSSPLQIYPNVLKSAPKKNQKDFSFTGHYYSTAPIKDAFKQRLMDLYQKGYLTKDFCDYFDIPPYGIDRSDPTAKSSDSVEKMKKWQAGERGFNFKAASDAKLKANLKICREIGFDEGAAKIQAELDNRKAQLTEKKAEYNESQKSSKSRLQEFRHSELDQLLQKAEHLLETNITPEIQGLIKDAVEAAIEDQLMTAEQAPEIIKALQAQAKQTKGQFDIPAALEKLLSQKAQASKAGQQNAEQNKAQSPVNALTKEDIQNGQNYLYKQLTQKISPAITKVLPKIAKAFNGDSFQITQITPKYNSKTPMKVAYQVDFKIIPAEKTGDKALKKFTASQDPVLISASRFLEELQLVDPKEDPKEASGSEKASGSKFGQFLKNTADKVKAAKADKAAKAEQNQQQATNNAKASLVKYLPQLLRKAFASEVNFTGKTFTIQVLPDKVHYSETIHESIGETSGSFTLVFSQDQSGTQSNEQVKQPQQATSTQTAQSQQTASVAQQQTQQPVKQTAPSQEAQSQQQPATNQTINLYANGYQPQPQQTQQPVKQTIPDWNNLSRGQKKYLKKAGGQNGKKALNSAGNFYYDNMYNPQYKF